jgi:hypothetical protein
MTPRPVEDDQEVEEIGLEPSTEEEERGATKVGVGGYELNIDNSALPYFGIVLSAIILLIAVIVGDFNKNEGYGIAVAVVNMVFGLFGAYMASKNRVLYENPLGTLPYLGEFTWGSGLAQFLFMWSFVAAGVLTFNGPFLVTSNGFFACWAQVLFALMAMGITTEALRSQAGGLGYYNALLVASIIQICAIIPEMGGGNNGQSTYSLVLCILTIIFVLAFGAYPNVDKIKFPTFAVFAICWIVMASYVTFKGPFIETGNGYFSAWLGCGLAVMIAGSLVP